MIVKLSDQEVGVAMGALHFDRHIDHLLTNLEELQVLWTLLLAAVNLSRQVLY